MSDLNKTPETIRATVAAAVWLDSLGCKPVETEVPLAAGWVADLAGMWEPTMTEAKKSRLLRDIVPDPVAERDAGRMHELIRRYGSRFTIAVEVKTSVSDAKKDLGRKYANYGQRPQIPPPAHLLVLAAPRKVLDAVGYLHGWSKLILSDDGSQVIKHDGPFDMNPIHPGDEASLIAAVAVRRDHRTRHRAMRDIVRVHRRSMHEHREKSQAAGAVEGVAAWIADGCSGSLAERLRTAIGCKQLPWGVPDAVAKLERTMSLTTPTPEAQR